MSKLAKSIPETTVETLARSFFKESLNYGFTQFDYVRFVNFLLDMSMRDCGPQLVCQQQENETRGRCEGKSNGMQPLRLPIEGERITIRAFDPSRDCGQLENWLNDKSGRYFNISRITGKAVAVEHLAEDDSNLIGVISLSDATPIGVVAFLNHDKVQKKAELRKLIGDSRFRGQGLAGEATRLWIEYGITTLGLMKIYLTTLGSNLGNLKLNESLGFKIEGILRNEAFVDGQYHDILRMGLWTGDFPVEAFQPGTESSSAGEGLEPTGVVRLIALPRREDSPTHARERSFRHMTAACAVGGSAHAYSLPEHGGD